MITVYKQHNHIVVDKRVITDARLSFLAKGVYVFLLTDPRENEILHLQTVDKDFAKGLQELVDINAVQMTDTQFKAFDYYQQHINMSMRTNERDALITYIKTVNPLLLKEAMDRTAAQPRNNSFAYLKRILDDWLAKGYTTLNDVYEADSEHVEALKVEIKNKQKGATTGAELERELKNKGNYKGVTDDGSW